MMRAHAAFNMSALAPDILLPRIDRGIGASSASRTRMGSLPAGLKSAVYTNSTTLAYWGAGEAMHLTCTDPTAQTPRMNYLIIIPTNEILISEQECPHRELELPLISYQL